MLNKTPAGMMNKGLDTALKEARARKTRSNLLWPALLVVQKKHLQEIPRITETLSRSFLDDVDVF